MVVKYNKIIIAKAENSAKRYFDGEVNDRYVIGYMGAVVDYLMREIERLAKPERLDEIKSIHFTE